MTQWSQRTGLPVLIGRIANLYGPGQNLGKAQASCRSSAPRELERRPIAIWVSLDTLRDYSSLPTVPGSWSMP